MKRRSFVSAIVLSLSLLTPAYAQVRTFVSAQTGNDANPCTAASPCRFFDRAISVVASGGEVVALDSGGYGPFTINKELTIIAPSGVHAAIVLGAGSYTAVNVTLPSGVVGIRGLSISGGSTYWTTPTVGVSAIGSTGLSLVLENLHFTGLDYGVRYYGGGTLVVKDSVINHPSSGGISAAGLLTISGAQTARILVDNVVADHAGHQVSGPAAGFAVHAFGLMTVRDSSCNSCFRSFVASGSGAMTADDGGPGVMMLERSTSSRGYVGLVAGGATNQSGTGTLYVTGSTVAFSEFKGIEVFSGGAVHSYGNNTMRNNASDAISSTIPLQ